VLNQPKNGVSEIQDLCSEYVSEAMSITMSTLELLQFYSVDRKIKGSKQTTIKPLTIVKFETILLHRERPRVTESLLTE
jgi:hypothetical protein